MDIEALRNDTPGVRYGVHLNNAGAALSPSAVGAAIDAHLALETRLGGYEAEDAAAPAIADAYRAVETLLGATPGSVAFVENATVAFNQALSAIPFAPGDALLTTRHDYVSNQLAFLSLSKRFGVRILHAPDAPEGGVDPDAMAALMDRERPRVVTITHVPTNSGLVQPVRPVADAARVRGIPVLLDACQSVGQLPLDVSTLGVTFLSATARKFLRGPRGSGFLWIDPEHLRQGATPLFPDLRGATWVTADTLEPAPDARRFENWEFSWALVLGTAAAARVATGLGVEALRDRIRALSTSLRGALAELPGVQVLDRGPELAGIVTASLAPFPDVTPVVHALRERGIRTSALHRTSAVFDFDARGVSSAIRLSPHAYNTEEELETAVAALREILTDRGS
jgi:selenocysteine lyase/cysteine desulfurase